MIRTRRAALAKVDTGFPSGQTRSVCPEITLKQRDKTGRRFEEKSSRFRVSILVEQTALPRCVDLRRVLGIVSGLPLIIDLPVVDAPGRARRRIARIAGAAVGRIDVTVVNAGLRHELAGRGLRRCQYDGIADTLILRGVWQTRVLRSVWLSRVAPRQGIIRPW